MKRKNPKGSKSKSRHHGARTSSVNNKRRQKINTESRCSRYNNEGN